MRRRAAFVGTILALTASGCWGVPGQGPNRQANNPVETAISVANVATMAQVWSTVVGPQPEGAPDVIPEKPGPPVAAGGRVFVTTPWSLTALDPATGTRLWLETQSGGGRALDDEAFVVDDRLAVGISAHGPATPQASLWFDVATGSLVSGPQTMEPSSFRGQRVFSTGENVIFEPQSMQQTFARITDLDGSLVWSGRLGVRSSDEPRLKGSDATLGTTSVFHAGLGLMATAPGDGTYANGVRAYAVSGPATNCGPPERPNLLCPQWVTPIDGATATSPVLADGEATAYVGTDAGTVYALDTATGNVLWSAAVGSSISQPPALDGETLLVPTASGALVALDATGCGAATCAPLWTTAAGSELTVQPAIAGGVVFTGAADGTVAAYATAGCGAASCAPLWSVSTGSRVTGAPAISQGKVFVGIQDGHILAFAPA